MFGPTAYRKKVSIHTDGQTVQRQTDRQHTDSNQRDRQSANGQADKQRSQTPYREIC